MVNSWKQRYNGFFGREYLSNIIDALITTADKSQYQEEINNLIATKEAFQEEIKEDNAQYNCYYLKKQKQMENIFAYEDIKKFSK